MPMNTRNLLIASLLVALVAFAVASVRPTRYRTKVTFFVPLTLLEKQVAQNGIGFGSPAEVDAHIELMRSDAMAQYVHEQLPNADVEYEVSRTRNGAVELLVRAALDTPLVAFTRSMVHFADSLKTEMLRGNIEQSYAFVVSQLKQCEAQVDTLQSQLDALRMDASSDSILLKTRQFRLEKQYGAAVEEFTRISTQRDRLHQMRSASVPTAYFIDSNVLSVERDSWSPWLLALLAGITTALGGLAWRALWLAPNPK